ncbi:MAG TPA: NAD(P)/FAD-dependent oxidoreductase [Nostocaceae cyanobacterium]|nr:NAD(P)/FAD-dependent oxidoreductase [Nostocaceae cyanobacterium]
MSIYSNILTTKIPTSDFVAWPFIDNLYDYIEFLNHGYIAELPKDKWGTEVAIIGAGAAGMVAAYELLKIGVHPVIFEATDRIGGRAYSKYFLHKNGYPSLHDIAELGSMRFPPSSRVFFYYIEKLGLKNYITDQFPNPGKVPTKLYYGNKIHDWPINQEHPSGGDFDIIYRDWTNFIKELTEPLHSAWQKWQEIQRYGDERVAQEYRSQVQYIWQKYINKYKDVDVFQAISEGMPWWTSDHISKFGSLGFGTGGFGPLYAVNFLEILRIMVNMWGDNQQLLTCGISKLMESFYNQRVIRPDGSQISLKEIEALKINTPISAIEYMEGQAVLHFSDRCLRPKSYSSVIVATSTRAMEIMGLTLPTPSITEKVEILNEQIKRSIRNIHLIDSSKLFVRTKTKFWKNNPHIPQNIQTDELPRSIYALDYPHTEHGIVLVSYILGDRTNNLLALDKMERLELFKQSIAQVSPEFAENLVPMNGESDVLSIDWEKEKYHYGAFKLQYPGQEPYIHSLYYQFLGVNDKNSDTGVYLAGDSVSWSGGWTEGAFHTGLNAACAAARHIGSSLRNDSPLTQNPNLYQY